MCDYSLELYRSRPATESEQYTLHRFPSGTMGFVAGIDCETAVCMLNGAKLSLTGINETVQRAFSVGPNEKVTMTRLEVTGHAHRDAVRFANGREVLLQSLNVGVSCQIVPPGQEAVEKMKGFVEDPAFPMLVQVARENYGGDTVTEPVEQIRARTLEPVGND